MTCTCNPGSIQVCSYCARQDEEWNNEIQICRLPGGRHKSDRLYYFQGNFFHPLELVGRQIGIVKAAIRKFMDDNAKLVARHRAHPLYKTLLELFDMPAPVVGGDV